MVSLTNVFSPELIKYHGYQGETVHTNTKDGYVLAVHRILPTKKHVSGIYPVPDNIEKHFP